MEAGEEYSHFCDDQQNKCFVVYNLKDRQTRKYEVPYETVYLFDSVQVKNDIYFTGGGLPPAGGKPEQFFHNAVKVSILPDMDTTSDKLNSMKVSRANHTIVALTPNLLYVVGGCNSKAEIPSCEEYNVAKKTWREIAYLNEKKMWVSVCGVDGKYLYAFGGSSNLKPKESEMIEYLDSQDAAAKFWTKVTITAGKESWRRSFFIGCLQTSSDEILLFGGLVNQTEVDETSIFNFKKCAMTKGEKLARPDAFYRTKPGRMGNDITIVGSCEGDLHTYNIADKKWGLVKKETWNPEVGFTIKADTF